MIKYLSKNNSSPFQNNCAIFVRKKYQKLIGNLSHSYMSTQLDWNRMSDDEIFLFCNILRAEEMGRLVDEFIFDIQDNIFQVYENRIF